MCAGYPGSSVQENQIVICPSVIGGPRNFHRAILEKHLKCRSIFLSEIIIRKVNKFKYNLNFKFFFSACEVF